MIDYYMTSVVEENFSDGALVADKINRWVNGKTYGLIPKLFDKSLDSDTKMLLLNSIYFRGVWLNPFAKVLTSPREFINENGETKMVSTMEQQESLKYLDARQKEEYALQVSVSSE